MKNNWYRGFAMMLFLNGYTAFAAIVAWHGWHYDHELGLRFWSLMIFVSFYVTAQMIRECRILILPPLLCVAWLIAIGVSPVFLVCASIRTTWRWMRDRRANANANAKAGRSPCAKQQQTSKLKIAQPPSITSTRWDAAG